MMVLGKLSVVALFAVVSVVLSAPADTYTDKYDNIDLDEILNNERLYKKYFECVRGAGKCTPDGAELKEKIPEALKTECAKCNEKQKNGVKKVLEFMIQKKPDDFKVLEDQFDSEGVYRKKYEEQKKSVQEGKAIQL